MEHPQALVKTHLRRLRQEKVSGAVVYFDGVSAFYSAVRAFLCDGSFNAEDNRGLLELLDMVCPGDDNRQQELFAILCGPSILPASDTPKILRRFVAATLQGTCFTMEPQTNGVWATRTGTCPATPLADLFFQGVFAHALAEIEALVNQSEIQVEPPVVTNLPSQICAPAATWLDDLAVLLRAPCAYQLIPQVRTLIMHVEKAISAVGIDTNFAPQKTEVMIAFYGAGSQSLRTKWLCDECPKLEVELHSGTVAVVSLTDQYIHLGSVAHYSGCDYLDVQRRRTLAQVAFEPVKRLLRNPYLASEEKLRIVLRMPMRKFLFGAGAWALATAQEHKTYEATYMSLLRQSCWVVAGLSGAGLTNVQVCSLLGVLEPADALAVERARYLCQALQKDQGYLKAVLVAGCLLSFLTLPKLPLRAGIQS